MNNKFLLGALLLILILFPPSTCFGWCPNTHYFINAEADPNSPQPYIYRAAGTGPDMFLFQEPWVDYAHAPVPKNYWWTRPNFAYLMMKINKIGDKRSQNYFFAKGWGGHIASDWVAHNMLSMKENFTNLAVHIAVEEMMDGWVANQYGRIPVPLEFKLDLVRKAFINYRLMMLDEENRGKGYSEKQLKEFAINQAPTMEDLIDWSERFATSIYIQSHLLPAFPYAPYAQTNFDESVNRVRTWFADPTAYDIPQDLKGNCQISFLSKDKDLNDSFAQTAFAADNVDGIAEQQVDETALSFWGEIAKKAIANGAVEIKTTTLTDAWGEKTIKITPIIVDSDRLRDKVEEIVESRIVSPPTSEDLVYALLQKKLVIEKQTDLNVIMDFTAPSVTNLSPADGTLAEGLKPIISCIVQDAADQMGVSGIEPSSIVMHLDGNYVAHDFNPDLGIVSFTPSSPLSSGTHTVSITVEDKAYNRTVKNWSFVIDPYPPETTASIEPASPNGLNNWYISDVTLTLSATDNPGGSGVDKTEYSLDNGVSWQIYNDPLIFTQDGEINLLYRSTDKVGNVEKEKSISFKIDKTAPDPPVISFPLDNGRLVNPVSFSGQAERFSTVKVYSDGEPIFTTTSDITGQWANSMVLSEGPHTITATSTDEAGNTSLVSASVRVSVKYKTTLIFTSASQTSGRYSDAVSFSAKLTNRLGPVSGKTILFKIGSQEISAITGSDGVATASIKLSQIPGSYTLEASFPEDDYYLSSSDSAPFEILKENVIVSVSEKEGFYDDNLSLDALVRDDERDNLLNGPYAVEFKIGQKLVGSAQIDQNGQAKISWQIDLIPTTLTEAHSISVNFTGCDYYNSAKGEGAFTLRSANWLIQSALDDLKAVKTTNKHSHKDIKEAIEDLGDSLKPTLWADASRLNSKRGHELFEEAKDAIEELRKIVDEKGEHGDATIKDGIEAVVNKITKACELLAKVAIFDAKNASVTNPKFQKKVDKEILKAEKHLQKAQLEMANGNPAKAIDQLKKSWHHAQLALKFAQGKDEE